MLDVKKEVMIDIKSDPTDKRVIQVLDDRNAPSDVEGIRMSNQGIVSIYHFDYGNATYEVEKFIFYDLSGTKYSTGLGCFEGAYHRCYPTVVLGSKQEKPKRVTLTDDSYFLKAFKNDEIFFVSLGKNYLSHGKPRAVVYVPFSYLTAIGFQVIKETRTTDYEVRTDLTLYTPTFQFFLTGETTKLIDNLKRDMLKELEACEVPAELAEFIRRWQHKF